MNKDMTQLCHAVNIEEALVETQNISETDRNKKQFDGLFHSLLCEAQGIFECTSDSSEYLKENY